MSRKTKRNRRVKERRHANNALFKKKSQFLENLYFIAAVLLLPLNLFSLAWQISTYWKSREDRISTSVSFVNLESSGKMDIEAEVVNYSEQPLYVKDLVISLLPPNTTPVAAISEGGDSGLVTEVVNTIKLVDKSSKRSPLQPMEQRVYYAKNLDIEKYAALVDKAGDNVDLAVYTNKGEIHRHKLLGHFFQYARQHFGLNLFNQEKPNIEVFVGEEFELKEGVINGKPVAYVYKFTSPIQESQPSQLNATLTFGTVLLIGIAMVVLAYKLGARRARA